MESPWSGTNRLHRLSSGILQEKRVKVYALFMVLFLCVDAVAAQSGPEAAEEPLQAAIALQQHSQQQSDDWQLQQQRLLAEYDRLQQQAGELRQRTAELQRQCEASREQITKARQALVEGGRFRAELQPFLSDSLQLLRQQQAVDLPFDLELRRQRLEDLDCLLTDRAVPAAEALQALLAYLQQEVAAGREVVTALQPVEIAGESRLLQLVRLGRLLLLAQSPDGRESLRYDSLAGRWQPLESRWHRPLGQIIAMAQRRRPLELVQLPLGRLVQP
jgi:hypothetical protein